MLTWINDRLDRRWKRLLALLWIPVFLITVAQFAHALVNIYVVRYADDDSAYACHYQLAMGDKAFVMSDTFARTNEEKRRAALERSSSRTLFNLSSSSDARVIERTPEFRACMSQGPSASWWIEYPFAWSRIASFLVVNCFIGLVVFPRFWRKLRDWIQVQPRA
jgi:hypothetical protein